ncbi:MAG: hypothetical protein AB4080_14050 [Trichodesmium sp.]
MSYQNQEIESLPFEGDEKIFNSVFQGSDFSRRLTDNAVPPIGG